MEIAKAAEGQSRTDVLKDVCLASPPCFLSDLNYFVQLFKSNKEEGSVRTTESKSQFKVVSDKRQSILAKAGNPAGWVNRVAEKQDIASSGKEWRSDAYVLFLFCEYDSCGSVLIYLILCSRFNITPPSGDGDAEKRTSAPGHVAPQENVPRPIPRV